jgi:hypothetical protein
VGDSTRSAVEAVDAGVQPRLGRLLGLGADDLQNRENPLPGGAFHGRRSTNRRARVATRSQSQRTCSTVGAGARTNFDEALREQAAVEEPAKGPAHVAARNVSRCSCGTAWSTVRPGSRRR